MQERRHRGPKKTIEGGKEKNLLGKEKENRGKIKDEANPPIGVIVPLRSRTGKNIGPGSAGLAR